MVTQTQSYLCGSAPVQKALSKLPAVRGGRSQCGSARGRSEEAGQRHFKGLPIGSDDVRAPVPVAKHVSQSPLSLPEKFMRLLSLAIRVPQAISWRKRQFIFTDEVSRCLRPPGGVKLAYKALPKGPADASAWRRSSQQPPPQRWQQIGSSSSLLEESNVKPQRRCYENRIYRTVSIAGYSPQMARLVLFQSTQPLPAKKHPASSSEAGSGSRHTWSVRIRETTWPTSLKSKPTP
jgi:hypothetical protein